MVGSIVNACLKVILAFHYLHLIVEQPKEQENSIIVNALCFSSELYTLGMHIIKDLSNICIPEQPMNWVICLEVKIQNNYTVGHNSCE